MPWRNSRDLARALEKFRVGSRKKQKCVTKGLTPSRGMRREVDKKKMLQCPVPFLLPSSISPCKENQHGYPPPPKGELSSLIFYSDEIKTWTDLVKMDK